MAIPELIVFLYCARQARLLGKACLAEAEHFKSCCRFWLTMAHQAQPLPLP